VLAAMYMLRLISAVLHQNPGPAVTEAALDLRSAELAILVPLVAILLFLSAWPDAITGHSFASPEAESMGLHSTPFDTTTHVGWSCYAPPC
jgi:NADH:ubiquinone oxidoreductase subunit 4 (subunit M)